MSRRSQVGHLLAPAPSAGPTCCLQRPPARARLPPVAVLSFLPQRSLYPFAILGGPLGRDTWAQIALLVRAVSHLCRLKPFASHHFTVRFAFLSSLTTLRRVDTRVQFRVDSASELYAVLFVYCTVLYCTLIDVLEYLHFCRHSCRPPAISQKYRTASHMTARKRAEPPLFMNALPK